MAWTYLLLAGLFEIGFALGLKHTDGFTRLWPSLGTAAAAAVNKKARHKRIVSRPEVQKQTRVVTTRDDVGAALDALLG